METGQEANSDPDRLCGTSPPPDEENGHQEIQRARNPYAKRQANESHELHEQVREDQIAYGE